MARPSLTWCAWAAEQPSALLDSDAHNKALDADATLQELGSDLIAYAYVTATVTVFDENARVADERLRLVEKVIQGARSRVFPCSFSPAR